MPCVLEKLPDYVPNMKIGLLIGSNCPRALEPLEVIPAKCEGPFAVRYRHGWVLTGPVSAPCSTSNEIVTCNRIMYTDVKRVKQCKYNKEMAPMVEYDVSKDVTDKKEWSEEEPTFLKNVAQQHKLQNGDHIMMLPWDKSPNMPQNPGQAGSMRSRQRKNMKNVENDKEENCIEIPVIATAVGATNVDETTTQMKNNKSKLSAPQIKEVKFDDNWAVKKLFHEEIVRKWGREQKTPSRSSATNDVDQLWIYERDKEQRELT